MRRLQARATAMAVDDMWAHDRFEGGGAGGGGGASVGRLNLESGAKLLISNLHHAVTTEDVKARGRAVAAGAAARRRARGAAPRSRQLAPPR